MEYAHEIMFRLGEEEEGTELTHANRDDWQGVSEVFDLYQSTEGKAREEIIRAMGEIIENAEKHPTAAAQVLLLVTSLDLTQVHDSVAALMKKQDFLRRKPDLQRELDNYCASRHAAKVF